MDLLYYINLAFLTGLSTTYGYGEWNCGDIGKARPCSKGAITSSGQIFDPELPTAAIAVPANMRFSPFHLYMKVGNGPCIKVLINDKLNPRYVGKLGFDLTPKTLELLTGRASPKWLGKVSPCIGEI